MKSNNQSWATPDSVYFPLHEEFNFTLDPCADETNHKCDTYFTIEDDGLSQSWEGHTAFINPPYKYTKLWVEKACDEYIKNGVTSVLLIPARPDTKAWQEIIAPYAAQIRFLKGRIKFVGAKDPAPFPSAVVIFSTKTYFERVKFVNGKIHDDLH